MRGRGKNAGHGKKKGEHEVPQIGFDYAFLGAGYSRLRGPAKEEAHALVLKARGGQHESVLEAQAVEHAACSICAQL